MIFKIFKIFLVVQNIRLVLGISCYHGDNFVINGRLHDFPLLPPDAELLEFCDFCTRTKGAKVIGNELAILYEWRCMSKQLPLPIQSTTTTTTLENVRSIPRNSDQLDLPPTLSPFHLASNQNRTTMCEESLHFSQIPKFPTGGDFGKLKFFFISKDVT